MDISGGSLPHTASSPDGQARSSQTAKNHVVKEEDQDQIQNWPTEALQAILEEHNLACPDAALDRVVLCELVRGLMGQDVGKAPEGSSVEGGGRERPGAPPGIWPVPARNTDAWTMVDDQAEEVLACVAQHQVTLLIAPTGQGR